MTDAKQVKKEDKSNVEQVRVRGKNSFDVVNQIAEKFNFSNGWVVKKVNMQMVNNLEVFLERNVNQADSEANTKVNTKVDTKVVDDAKVKEETTEDSKASQKSDEDSKVTTSSTASNTASKPSTRKTKSKQ